MCTSLIFSLSMLILCSFSALIMGIPTSSPKEIFGPISTTNCGHRPGPSTGPVFKVKNGKEIKPYAWPWLVNIQILNGSEGLHLCGGSLIRVADNVNKTDVVITAAHCVDLIGLTLRGGIKISSYRQFQVVAGQFSLKEDETSEVNRGIENAHFERDWGRFGDIAVIILSEEIDFNTIIQPVCLPEHPNSKSDPDIGQKCTVVGWGRLNETLRRPSDTPQEAVVPVTRDPSFVCDGYTKDICAGYADYDKGACKGDSGGPLNCELTPNKWTLSGVVSSGVHPICTNAGMPGIYARVTYLLDWIKRKVCTHSKFRAQAEGCQH